MRDAIEHALDWHEAGDAVALATVTETWGSAPCPVGSIMAVSRSGRVEGSVSGGCVETAVMQAAFETIEGGPPRLLSFAVSDGNAWSVGLACGGTIRVFVEALRPASRAI
jgi:xanthine dehydrogenase accessory factor